MHHQTYRFHSTRCQQIPREASLRCGPKWFKSCSGNDQTWATWAPPKPVSPGSWEPTPRVCTKAQWRHELRAAVDSVPHRRRLHKPSARPPYLPTYGGDWHRPGAAAEAVRSPERRGGTGKKRRAREPTPRSGRKGPAGVRMARLGDTRARGVRPLRALPGRPATAPRRRTGRRPATTRRAGSPPGARPEPALPAIYSRSGSSRLRGSRRIGSRPRGRRRRRRRGRGQRAARRPPPGPSPPPLRSGPAGPERCLAGRPSPSLGRRGTGTAARSAGSLRSAPAPPHAPTPGSARRRPGSFSFCFQNKLYWSLFPLTSCKQTTNSSPPPRSPLLGQRRLRAEEGPNLQRPGNTSTTDRKWGEKKRPGDGQVRKQWLTAPAPCSSAPSGRATQRCGSWAVVSSWDSGRVTPVSFFQRRSVLGEADREVGSEGP